MAIRKRTWESGGATKTAWVVDYKDGEGKRRLKTFKTKKEADTWAPKALVQVQDGTHTADSASITVAEAGELWIRRAELEGLERSTVRHYRHHVELHINPHIGKVKLSKLTSPMVESFKKRLLQDRSRAMVIKVLSSLKSLIGEAQLQGGVSQNVARGVKVRRVTRDEEEVEIPTKEEVGTMLRAVTGRWRPLFITAAFTGMRASELRGLTWEDVDFDERVIQVRRRADAWNQIGAPKSKAGRRDIIMTPMVLNTLKEWKLECPKGEKGLVFPNGSGNVEALANIFNRGFKPLQIACGIVDDDGRVKYGMHTFRHFYASWLIEQGFPPKKIQTLLGHSKITMTFDVYGHLFPSQDDDHKRMELAERAVMG